MTSDGSDSFTLTSQPRPYGSLLSRPATSRAAASFTSMTSPDNGAYRSESVLTDSTSAGLILADLVAQAWGAEKHQLLQIVLSEPGDAERGRVALDAGPVVLAVVSQLCGVTF